MLFVPLKPDIDAFSYMGVNFRTSPGCGSDSSTTPSLPLVLRPLAKLQPSLHQPYLHLHLLLYFLLLYPTAFIHIIVLFYYSTSIIHTTATTTATARSSNVLCLTCSVLYLNSLSSTPFYLLLLSVIGRPFNLVTLVFLLTLTLRHRPPRACVAGIICQ